MDAPWSPDLGPIPVLSIFLTPSQLEATVTESQLGSVTFQGTVTVDQMRVQSSTTSLQAVVNTGWPVVISPQTFKMTGPGEESFQATVIVPPATSAYLTGNIIVTGSCKVPGLAPVVAAAAAVVTVGAYYLAEISVSGSGVEVAPGEQTTLGVEVLNRANTNAQLRVFVVDKPKEVRVSFSDSEFQVEPDESVTFNVSIAAVSGASPGDYSMSLVVEADRRDGGTQRVASMNMSVYIPSIGARIGMTGVVAISGAIAAAVVVVVLWRKGKLVGFKRLVPSRILNRKDSGANT